MVCGMLIVPHTAYSSLWGKESFELVTLLGYPIYCYLQALSVDAAKLWRRYGTRYAQIMVTHVPPEQLPRLSLYPRILRGLRAIGRWILYLWVGVYLLIRMVLETVADTCLYLQCVAYAPLLYWAVDAVYRPILLQKDRVLKCALRNTNTTYFLLLWLISILSTMVLTVLHMQRQYPNYR